MTDWTDKQVHYQIEAWDGGAWYTFAGSPDDLVSAQAKLKSEDFQSMARAVGRTRFRIVRVTEEVWGGGDNQMEKPRILLVDVDGVLTDGRMYVSHTGERFKAFNARDNRALAEFVASGWYVALVSTSKWPGLQSFAERTGVVIYPNNPKTTEDIRQITNGHPYIAVGDDVFDLEMLSGAEIAFAPADCDPALNRIEKLVKLDVNGGAGVIAALTRVLL